MESMTSTTCLPVSAVVLHGAAPAGTSAAYEGTGLPVAGSGWTAARIRQTATAPAATALTNLLPTSDVVVFDGLAGVRSWSPPV